jgi:hypothetical protein
LGAESGQFGLTFHLGYEQLRGGGEGEGIRVSTFPLVSASNLFVMALLFLEESGFRSLGYTETPQNYSFSELLMTRWRVYLVI